MATIALKMALKSGAKNAAKNAGKRALQGGAGGAGAAGAAGAGGGGGIPPPPLYSQVSVMPYTSPNNPWPFNKEEKPPPDAWGRSAAGVVVAGGATAATVHAANTWPEKFLQMLPFILFIILMAYAVYYAFIWKDPAEKQGGGMAPPPVAKKRGIFRRR